MAVASSGVGALLAARTQTAHKGGRAAGCLVGGVSRTAVCGTGTVMADFSATAPLIDGKVATVGRILEFDIFSMKVLSDTSIRPTLAAKSSKCCVYQPNLRLLIQTTLVIK